MQVPIPVVAATKQCNCWDGGVRCTNETGNTEPGIDADLCPKHREMMALQREEWSHGT